MVPEPPLKKIIYSNLEVVFKTFVEAVACFGIAAVLTKCNPLIAVAAIVVYTMFTLLLVSVNIASLRFIGSQLSVGIQMVIYYLLVLLLVVPGIIGGVVVSILIGGEIGMIFGLLVGAGWELAISMGFFAMSVGILHNSDLPVAKSIG
jgi:hypothetical protein